MCLYMYICVTLYLLVNKLLSYPRSYGIITSTLPSPYLSYTGLIYKGGSSLTCFEVYHSKLSFHKDGSQINPTPEGRIGLQDSANTVSLVNPEWLENSKGWSHAFETLQDLTYNKTSYAILKHFPVFFQALVGLIRCDTVKQIISKLPLISDGQLQRECWNSFQTLRCWESIKKRKYKNIFVFSKSFFNTEIQQVIEILHYEQEGPV